MSYTTLRELRNDFTCFSTVILNYDNIMLIGRSEVGQQHKKETLD